MTVIMIEITTDDNRRFRLQNGSLFSWLGTEPCALPENIALAFYLAKTIAEETKHVTVNVTKEK